MKGNFGNTSDKAGILYAVAAYSTWGVLPLYWHLLVWVPALEILAHRILWSFILVASIVLFTKRWSQLKSVMADAKSRNSLFIASMLITVNWFIYIWAVNEGHVIEASLGYYINPLFSILLGMVVLKERMSFWQIIALVLAGAGVALITFQYGRFPWIAFLLAITFGLYGLAKKLIRVDSMVGLTLETVMVTPFAFLYIVYLQTTGVGSLGAISVNSFFLLAGAGVVTVFPLFWFAQGAKRVPLSTIGFIQYLSPTISLLLGIFIFKESFTLENMICFGLIWLALLLYSISHAPFMRAIQPNFFKKSGNITKGA